MRFFLRHSFVALAVCFGSCGSFLGHVFLASPREIDSYFVFLPFATNRTNCCHLLTKLLGDGFEAHSSLCRSTILSLSSLDSSLVLVMVESLESDGLIASVDRCLLYR